MVSRRVVLGALGAAGLAVAGTAAALGGRAPADGALRLVRADAGPMPGVKQPVVRVERVRSRARGRDVDLVTVLPSGVPARGLPMSVLLHGLSGTARHAAVGGLPRALVAAVRRGVVPPFGFAAVDGGDHYWHENVPGDDPMAMLLDEVPRWLLDRGFREPFACTGVSMGGFGALLYARRRAERREPAVAVAAISPGLHTSWPEMAKRGAFTDEAQWAALDPLRHLDALRDVPLGVWVGDRDWFIEGARELIAGTRPLVASVTPGGHDEAFYRDVVPDVVRFLGGRLTAG
ncbi:alpha/beta hydrolase [Saccharothrix algeriensis]|uniref:Acyl-CoA:diacylglycerol acyltransferase n=1 Tax=Saccharothrix algeriensis TaxID=173560 RepID=A0A8T8I2Y3_9PSEU|nr:alpha/beta hydrolase [Saccharothrix algeriensis]